MTEKPHVETGWIQTYTGKKFHPLEPRIENICIEDIAHALANTCRFGGHCLFYSVAQHSCYVSDECPTCPLWGLLHDAAEAYLVDLPRPIKQQLRRMEGGKASLWDVWESRLMMAIAARFGLPWPQPKEVDEADMLLLATEARDLMAPLHQDWHYQEANGFRVRKQRIVPWDWCGAKILFEVTFRRLTNA
jgi:hypothetical protein